MTVSGDLLAPSGKNLNLWSLLLVLNGDGCGQLSFMTLAQPQISTEDNCRQKKGADNSYQQAASVTFLFFFYREWFSF